MDLEKLEWTKEPPSNKGMYWWRHISTGEPTLLAVTGPGLCVPVLDDPSLTRCGEESFPKGGEWAKAERLPD
jgi:hypothetical protein